MVPPSSTLAVFDVSGADIRFGLTEDGTPYSVAADFAKSMGYRQTKNALDLLDDDEKGFALAETPGGRQRLAVIYEDGMWELIFRSTLPGAKAIKARVKAILREIRETGSYSAEPTSPALPQDYEEALVHLLSKVRENKQLESKVRELEPAAQSWNVLATATGDVSVADAAKILARDPRIETGPRRLFNLLITMKWAYRQQADNRPRVMQYAVERGWLSELPQSHNHPETGELILDAPQVRVTVKGLHELHKRLGGDAPLQLSA
jgi:prophage antirepressor-like protein